MPQIINKTWFNKNNELYLPLAVANPVPTGGQPSPSYAGVIDSLCVKIERELLLKALGVSLYNELQLALADLDNPLNAKWHKLVNGESYGDKIWIGLKSDYSFIAYRVHEVFLTENSDQLTALGVAKANVKNAENAPADYRIAKSNNQFLKGYQGGFLSAPIIFENVTDWYGQQIIIEPSLWQYLLDKREDFPTWNPDNFQAFDWDNQVNSFGI